MRWLCLQHVPFEGPAAVGDFARRAGHELTRVELWTGAPLPPADEAGGVVVLGGPMNVYEEDRYPWLAREKRFLEAAIATGRPVLGICLGAQLLSVVLGGRVTRNREREIGWFPVERTEAAGAGGPLAGLPARFVAFHWHGDRFSIPPGAVHAARSEACEEQAFVYDGRVVGLQFHLESTPASIRALVEHCPEDLADGPYVQDPTTMEGRAGHAEQTHALLADLLTRLAASERRT